MTINTLHNFSEFWDNGLIIFDTCCLLRMYEYKLNSAIQLKDILDYKRDSIWIPHKVSEEFNNRKAVVKERQEKKYTIAVRNIRENPSRYEKIIKGILKECEGERYSEEFTLELRNILQKIQSGETVEFLHLENYAIINENEVLDFLRSLKVEKILDSLFENIGQPYSTDELATINSEWGPRFLNRIPPGFKDGKNEHIAPGDFVIWKQILDKAQQYDRKILFVTADQKADYWYFNQQLNTKVVHPQLMQEVKDKLGTNKNFAMITLQDFFQYCSSYLNSDVTQLMAHLQIDEIIRDRFDTWFPEELMETVKEYLDEDSEARLKIENSLDSCYDTHDINGFEYPEVEEVEYDIDTDAVYYSGTLKISADIGAKAHFAGEDYEVGSSMVELRVFFKCNQRIEWASQDSSRVALEDKLNDMEILEFEILSVEGDFDPDDYEPDEYEPDDYEPDEYEPDEYEPDEYEPDEYIEDDEPENDDD